MDLISLLNYWNCTLVYEDFGTFQDLGKTHFETFDYIGQTHIKHIIKVRSNIFNRIYY